MKCHCCKSNVYVKLDPMNGEKPMILGLEEYASGWGNEFIKQRGNMSIVALCKCERAKITYKEMASLPNTSRWPDNLTGVPD
jgi:hypothetical protein